LTYKLYNAIKLHIHRQKAMTKTVGYLSEINSEHTTVEGMQK